MEKILNYIDGKLYPPQKGGWLENIEPATGKVYSQVPASTQEDVTAAYLAAREAFHEWADMPINERSRILSAVADGIEANLEALALAESTDNGKPLSLARTVDIPRAAANFRYFAHAITQFHNESYDMGTAGFNYTLRKPLGVAGLISPWNLPLYLFTWKIAPALAAGNTAVAKPSEVTPMTAYRLSQICIDAGLPDGVLNIVHGTGPAVGEAIVSHPGIPAISFTGSTVVGRRIATVAAPMFKKLSLEMGGKNPNIIFADAEYEDALDTAVRSSFSNQGQICLCGSRILVEETIYDRFISDFADKVRKLKVGDPLDPETDIGAIVSRDQLEKDLSYIELAKAEGGEILCGGKQVSQINDRCENGYFLEPTVITGLSQACRVNQEEIFGPVVTVTPFRDEAEALMFANSVDYGLACTIWTSNLKRAHRFAGAIESGIVWVNSWMVRDLRTPFGGVKQSGIGREGGFDALRFFTEPKNVFIQL
jgi:aminomuconate-semialdehyde/2-hydroxymuconate-6-semialdehyde dehydrogenase